MRDLERQRSTYTQLLDKNQTGMIFTLAAKTSQVKTMLHDDKKVKDMSPGKIFPLNELTQAEVITTAEFNKLS